MQPATVLSHAVLGFVVLALVFPLFWASRSRKRDEETVEPLTLGGTSRDALAWLKNQLPSHATEGGLLFLALLVVFFLVGCAANAVSYAVDSWGLLGVARLLCFPAWEDVRDPVRLPAFLKLLAKGTAEQIMEAQTFRFLYHLGRVTFVCGIVGFVCTIILRLFFSNPRTAKLFSKVVAVYAAVLVIGIIAKPIARELYDATLAFSLDACGERSLAARLYPAFAKLPPTP